MDPLLLFASAKSEIIIICFTKTVGQGLGITLDDEGRYTDNADINTNTNTTPSVSLPQFTLPILRVAGSVSDMKRLLVLVCQGH